MSSHTTATAASPPRHAPTHRVPVKHRVFGLDTRALWPAATVLAVGLLWSLALPALDDAVDWEDPIAAGDSIDLGNGARFVPPVGWQLEDGTRVGDSPVSGVSAKNASARVATGGAQISATGGTFDGDADALLDQVNANLSAESTRQFTITDARNTLVTTSGLVGVVEPFTSATGDGLVATFVLPTTDVAADAQEQPGDRARPQALTFVVDATREQFAAHSAEIDATLRSVAMGANR
ncbi:hypothetical protein [Rhodococcus sp. NPDC127528]|uniref:hypothetical protein n=1 Tax=unclassified Rhodococcus (in: high G+C Gram-positive bacteria) TaxID=192944 RepID=UPI0036273FD9